MDNEKDRMFDEFSKTEQYKKLNLIANIATDIIIMVCLFLFGFNFQFFRSRVPVTWFFLALCLVFVVFTCLTFVSSKQIRLFDQFKDDRNG